MLIIRFWPAVWLVVSFVIISVRWNTSTLHFKQAANQSNWNAFNIGLWVQLKCAAVASNNFAHGEFIARKRQRTRTRTDNSAQKNCITFTSSTRRAHQKSHRSIAANLMKTSKWPITKQNKEQHRKKSQARTQIVREDETHTNVLAFGNMTSDKSMTVQFT